ncbi:MAG: hypothetical protein WB791_04665 [Waddliaceae bacterium]
MKKLFFLMLTTLLMASVEADEYEGREDAANEAFVHPAYQNEQNGQRRCYRRYRYCPLRTNGYYYYYDNRYIPKWPGKIDYYWFDLLRR